MNSQGLTRRSFLRKTALSAAAVAGAPYIIPASAFGADGQTAPSNRIALGFVGLGKMGSGHLQGFLNTPGVQVVDLCDVDTERLEHYKEVAENYYAEKSDSGKFSGVSTTGEFRDLLDRDDIDAVVISTPDHWHGLVSVYAAKAGKDIYCEKPMTRTIAEGRAVVDAVRRYGRVFQTGSQQRSEYQGMFRRAVELTQAGAIGKLHTVRINVGPPPIDNFALPADPVMPTLDWDRWLGPAPWRPYSKVLCPHWKVPGFPNWRGHRDYAGGSFSDFGAHHFDIGQWAMGMDHTGPVEIIPPDGKEHEKLVFVYENGVKMYHGGEDGVVLVGTEGKILVDRSHLRSEPESILETKLGPNDPDYNRRMSHRDDWLHCIRTREKPIADVEIGHRTGSICQLGIIAYMLNRPLKWDPAAERFTNDEEANKFLSRPMRSPWRV